MSEPRYINADDAVKHLKWLAQEAGRSDPVFSAKWVIEFLNNFPQAVVDKRKSGYWRGKDGVHICSRCGEGSSYQYLFCPNCGADMRVSDDE